MKATPKKPAPAERRKCLEWPAETPAELQAMSLEESRKWIKDLLSIALDQIVGTMKQPPDIRKILIHQIQAVAEGRIRDCFPPHHKPEASAQVRLHLPPWEGGKE